MAGVEVLTAWEVFGVLVVLFVEFIFWVILFVIELVASLFKWRKPRKVVKPVLWRPKKLKNKLESDTNA